LKYKLSGGPVFASACQGTLRAPAPVVSYAPGNAAGQYYTV